MLPWQPSTIRRSIDRFQIWERDAFQAHRAAQRELARDGLAQLRAAQRAQRTGQAG